MDTLILKGQTLTLAEIESVSLSHRPVNIAPAALVRVAQSRALIEEILAAGETVYGVNTGFGKLSEVRIPAGKLAQLQTNLVRSHAGGVGQPLSEAESRAMLLLRANVLAKGFSGCRPALVELLVALLNAGVHPVIPEKGSVGASGDLAPLAHLALVVIGEGEAFYKGERMAGGEALRAGRAAAPIVLAAKEGLALLNGTQAMTAVGALAVARARRVAQLADLAGAMSLEALMGTPAAFDARIHRARPHAGQIRGGGAPGRTACRLSDSRVAPRARYARAGCLLPALHAAGAWSGARCAGTCAGNAGDRSRVRLRIIRLSFQKNSSKTQEHGVLSGGNFHGAPLAYAFDYAAIVLTDLAGITERRIDRLLNPDINEGLPAFLSPDPGLSSGFMIAQIVAAALINECQVLAHPSSARSIPTDGGKEDHVSMGMTGALKLRQIVEHAERIVGIELMCAAQGLEFRRPLRASREVERAHAAVRAVVPRLEEDRVLAHDIEAMAAAVRAGAFNAWCK